MIIVKQLINIRKMQYPQVITKALSVALAWFCLLDLTAAECSKEDNFIEGICAGKCLYEKHNKMTEKNKEALFKLSVLVGKSYSTDDANLPHLEGSKPFQYHIGICGEPGKGIIDEGSQGAAVQYRPGDEKPTIIGKLNEAEIMSGTDWIMLEYRGGDSYGHHCGNEGRRTVVMVVCDPGETEGRLQIIEENNNKTADCSYLFELSHSTACSGSQTGLSVGSIICIVFVVLVAVYLLGGFLYQRFVVGAKGLEQIPNYYFWQDFGNLQADGCDLLCRCGRYHNSRTYRGVGDDQLTSGGADEDDHLNPHDDRDDHLLPM